MIEETILNYLEDNLEVPVSLEVPGGESTYVVIERTSGGKENHISSATFAIQSVASTLYEAATLNEKVKEAMENIESLNEISYCSLNTDYNFTDTTTKKYRYQAVFDLIYY